MSVSEITKLADDGRFATTTSELLKEYPYLIECKPIYTTELFYWVEDNLTKEWTCRGAKDSKGVSFCQIFFKHQNDALMFKLTWIGKNDPWAWEHLDG